jgi:hypothetical protein
MNTGLYVEQSQIRDEMQRLAAGLVEEERKRGSAEQRRQDVENEVDELATSLFEQVRFQPGFPRDAGDPEGRC